MKEIYEKTIKELIEKNSKLMDELRKERQQNKELYKDIIKSNTRKQYTTIICDLHEIHLKMMEFSKFHNIISFSVCQVHINYQYKEDYVITIEYS